MIRVYDNLTKRLHSNRVLDEHNRIMFYAYYISLFNDQLWRTHASVHTNTSDTDGEHSSSKTTISARHFWNTCSCSVASSQFVGAPPSPSFPEGVRLPFRMVEWFSSNWSAGVLSVVSRLLVLLYILYC